ncbi:MAG: hypothetical protein FWG39_04135 [Alphaproteobacteria bacterium]|nr:hypothetical protein [Alphaproteobacteria bacterium]
MKKTLILTGAMLAVISAANAQLAQRGTPTTLAAQPTAAVVQKPIVSNNAPNFPAGPCGDAAREAYDGGARTFECIEVDGVIQEWKVDGVIQK